MSMRQSWNCASQMATTDFPGNYRRCVDYKVRGFPSRDGCASEFGVDRNGRPTFLLPGAWHGVRFAGCQESCTCTRSKRRLSVLLTAALACMLAACGSGSNSTGAAGTGSPTGGAGSTGVGTCSDLFDQGTVRTYSIDIAPDQWRRDPGRVQRHRDAAGRRQRLRRETIRSCFAWAARRSPTRPSSCTGSRRGCRP